MKHSLPLLSLVLLLQPVALAVPCNATPTPPEKFFSQPPGTDYYLANYSDYEAYLKRLAGESDRIKLVDIGKTAEGRTQWMAIISSPENLARLEHYRAIAEKLAKAKDINEEEARRLSAEGKAIVWIDAGMHATETITSQGQIQVIHRLLSQADDETIRTLKDCIILFAHDNPDGMELVSNWYMRSADPKKREFSTLPRLYQKYVGHDNNRDSFMAQMPETENINQVLFRQWYPQIIYNQHQTGPEGMVVFVPPFRDPFNYNYSPIVMTELNEIGFAMHSRLIADGKAGSGTRGSAYYSTWPNGMQRSVAYFHNSVGLLTEIIGGPTPTKIPLVPSTQLPRGDELMPIAPRDWHLQDSLDYQWTLNRAVIDYASRNRDRLLFNIYLMGVSGIEKGTRDNWTITPSKVDDLESAAPLKQEGADEYNRPRSWGPKKVDPTLYKSVLQAPEDRDARAYILPPDQADLPTAITFLNALIKNGVDVERADKVFSAGGKSYPAGSYVVRTAQAYRAHILDMFEPQDHPHDVEFPGGPPKYPYDVTGYTLAYQMGIDFDRTLDGVAGSFTLISDLLVPPPGHIEGQGTRGWIVGHETNNSFILTNRLLKAGVRPAWIKQAVTVNGATLQAGALWIPASDKAKHIVEDAVTELGLIAHRSNRQPEGETIGLKPVRIGLVDRYGGLISAGWIRWLLEKFEFPFELVYPQRLDAGKLQRDFDALVFTDGTIPNKGAWGTSFAGTQPKAEDIPTEYRPMLGQATDTTTVPAVADFVRGGGALIAIGSAGRFSDLLGAPLAPALTRRENGEFKSLDIKNFFVPGSILRARVDNQQPLGFGLPGEVNIFFNQSQTFVPTSGPGKASSISWFEGRDLLRSGWAVGQEKLAGTIAVAQADIGHGKLFLMGPDVVQRAQSYGTFKFLFNALLYGGAEKP